MSGELIVFGAEWCGPCRSSRPHLERYVENGGRATYVDVDSVRGMELAADFKVMSLPTVVRVGVDGDPRQIRVGPYGYDTLIGMLPV